MRKTNLILLILVMLAMENFLPIAHSAWYQGEGVVYDYGTCSITATAGAGGKIVPKGEMTFYWSSDPDAVHPYNKYKSQPTQVYNITPDKGYRISDVYINDIRVGTPTVVNGKCEAGKTKHSIAASFKQLPKITASAEPGGLIVPYGEVTVDYGGGVTFNITPTNIGPNHRHLIKDVIVNSRPQGPNPSHTFSNVTSDQTIHAVFEKAVQITAEAVTTGSNQGLINPSGKILIPHGSDKMFNIATFSDEYYIKDVMVDGVSVKGTPNYSERSPRDATYTFRNATTDHRLEATFRHMARIDATNNTGGTITPYGTLNLDYGSSKEFTIQTSNDYRIKEILVNNTPVTFTNTNPVRVPVANITGRNNTIRANFEPVCTFSINPVTGSISSSSTSLNQPHNITVAASGGSGSVAVTAPTGCAWTATSNANWIKITQGSNGSGKGTVNYSVEAIKTKTLARTGTLTIAGKTFTVTQQ